jgi:SpoVK/Ycf46/Vps4 family AAA+-type ATPase
VRDSVVNQLLAKLDGVENCGNVLVIGMTNRRELIDEAMLRPGRLEVHVEVGLPSEEGRRQILDIHTRRMVEAGFLPRAAWEGEFDNEEGGGGGGGGGGRGGILEALVGRTEGFTGAELAGLVRAASSFAVARHLEGTEEEANEEEMEEMEEEEGGGGSSSSSSSDETKKPILVTEADFLRGLAEMEPQLALVRRSRRRSVGALLGDLGLRDQYEAALCEHHDVSWEELVRMDDAQLRECGVDKVGHRVRILAAAARESAGVAL